VDAYSTARRYPQIIISDQEIPVQYNMMNGRSIVVQTFGEIGGNPTTDFPVDYQIEVCDHKVWDVNQQCPGGSDGNTKNVALWDFKQLANMHLTPGDEVGEHASVDHRVKFDVYASTKRTYLFLDGKPYACADMPTDQVPSGPVTVTWGEVLYHSGVDHTFAFHAAHMQTEQRRHYDNLGFSSGVGRPAWDESRFPCAAAISP